MIPIVYRARLGLALLIAVLSVWIGWLRGPAMSVPMWNVDEAIHAAAARTILDGGVMYRDAVDQRTPLSYYAFAAIFGVAGMNNLFAVRVVIAAMIVATAFGLFLLGRRIQGVNTGLWAAFTYAALANYLLFAGDTHAAHTEWFVALFTTAGAVVFIGVHGVPGFRRSVVAGVLFGLAFLSKQPALTDIGAPLGTLLYLGLLRAASWRQIAWAAAGLMAGLTSVIFVTAAALVAAGAGPDFLFYTWTYNVRFYGPEVAWHERLLSGYPLFHVLWRSYPLLLVSLILSGLIKVMRVAQLQYSETQYGARKWECFLLLWCATSLIGAMSSGRAYHHYFFQCLPPFAWLAATLPAWLSNYARGEGPLLRRLAAGVLAAGFAVSIVWTPLAARNVTPPPADPALPVTDYIRARSKADDKIFAWGYNPDIYLYADRAPASRFLYCSFQTGLIPWTNEAAEIDTRYAIVPGSMDTLLEDLARHRPTFIVDCGVGPHRRFSKYPLQNFPALYDFVSANYVEIDPPKFALAGFRVFMIRDTKSSPPLVSSEPGSFPAPTLGVPPQSNTFITSVVAAEPKLERLAVELDGVELVAVRFPPSSSIKYVAKVPPGLGNKQLQAIAYWVDGTRSMSPVAVIDSKPLEASAQQATEFGLPRVNGMIEASGVRALLSPNASVSDGQRYFNLHAPSLLRYSVPMGAVAIRGRYGFIPGAYAPENPTPTDGAVFVIRWAAPDGKTRVLLEKWRRPTAEPSDREVRAFHIPLESNKVGGTLEFEISPGPDGIMASDWTYWSDLMLEVSP